ncbi:LOB domain-containing protein 40 [Canna indica]|uniref:LOB domain-containing protein 40 n=1 Tax=Canna indica TaxID=4628 RepID=A0AAQ3QLA6_9LILI|nr:LOB domain-containing protein 40 [Canna indica]
MRMSCNGCRVLRKGCSENCSIRPCLQWIKSPESQANATVFLAKFYGRAGLINLINAGPDHLRPAIFRSLLYEACGRIVNPIYGSVGLLWSGSWQLTQAAVEAVLKGAPITQIPSDTVASAPAPPLKAYDIRHVSKDPGSGAAAAAAAELHKVNKSRSRFKRSGVAKAARAATPPAECRRARSHESAASRASERAGDEEEERREVEEQEEESMSSADTAEEAASHVSQGEPERAEEVEVGLELTLGFEPVSGPAGAVRAAARALCDLSGRNADARTADLGLALPGAS